MIKLMTLKTSFFALVLGTLLAGNATAQDQLGWRGPYRNGFYPDTDLLKKWDAAGPKLLWETLDVGKGHSSPVITNNHLYITGMNNTEDKETFSAYTLDGKREFVIEYGTPFKGSFPETRTTPTIVGEKAYVISGMGEVACINIKNGAIIWTVDGGTKFEQKVGLWGISQSPLVFDNKVIFSPGGEKAVMVALNALNGETVWETKGIGEICNYVSSLLIDYKGNKQIVSITGNKVIGVDANNGVLLWSYGDWGQSAIESGREKIAPNTPLYKDGKIFICNGYDLNSFMLRLSDDGKSVSLVWKNDVLDTHMGGFVLVDNTIYGSNWLNNSAGNWVAVDWATGKTLYDTKWDDKGKGAIITADRMLYCYDEKKGVVGLVNVNPEKFDVVSEFSITKGEGPFWAHPVINKGILYVRHGSALMAYSIRKN
jgi:outer membrane protein assembly factor BamB